jgi:hypothetical protein
MSSINFTCPHCSFSKQLPASAEGRQGNCPNCNAVVTISAVALVNLQQPAPQQPAPQQQRTKNRDKRNQQTGTYYIMVALTLISFAFAWFLPNAVTTSKMVGGGAGYLEFSTSGGLDKLVALWSFFILGISSFLYKQFVIETFRMTKRLWIYLSVFAGTIFLIFILVAISNVLTWMNS